MPKIECPRCQGTGLLVVKSIGDYARESEEAEAALEDARDAAGENDGTLTSSIPKSERTLESFIPRRER